MRDLIKELHEPKVSKKMLTTIVILLVGFFVWSYLTPFSRVVRASGSLVSSARTQIVQNLEGGIIQHIYANEGDQVTTKQPLVKFDTTRFEAQVEELNKKINSLNLRRLRLAAELAEQTQLIFPETLKQQTPLMAESELGLFTARQQAYHSKKKHFQRLIALKRKELKNITAYRSSGAVSQHELLNVEQQLSKLLSDKDNYLSEYKQEQSTEMAKIISELSLLKEKIKSSRDQLQRTLVLAPADGTINQLFFTTVGAVVSPGKTILEIVPDDGELIVEVRVLPKDIGYVFVGMNATLKLSAYDYSIYGTLQGKVQKVGADTVPDKNKRDAPPSYQVTLSINQKSLQQWQKKGLDLRTGMIVEAELEAGSMRVIDYILRPILKTRDALATI